MYIPELSYIINLSQNLSFTEINWIKYSWKSTTRKEKVI